jgi:hypothetical protein
MFYRFLREFEKHFSLKDTVREIQQAHPEMYPLPCYCLASLPPPSSLSLFLSFSPSLPLLSLSPYMYLPPSLIICA